MLKTTSCSAERGSGFSCRAAAHFIAKLVQQVYKFSAGPCTNLYPPIFGPLLVILHTLCQRCKQEFWHPFDPSEEWIDAGEPLLLEWSPDKKWSYAVAKESREENSDVTSIRVHHYNFDGKKLPCWVIQSELDSYLAGKTTKAPKEIHAETQPPEHVAYIGPIEVERITLCAHGYEVAKLTEQGLLTQMQHASLRYH